MDKNIIWKSIVSKNLLKIQLNGAPDELMHFFEHSIFIRIDNYEFEEDYVFELDGVEKTIERIYEPRDAVLYWKSELFQERSYRSIDEFEINSADRLLCLAIDDFNKLIEREDAIDHL